MSKYLVLAAVAVASLFVVDVAQAGRRRCASCSTCPGGVCAVPMAAAATPAAETAPVESKEVVASQPAPVMVSQPVSYRRFGFRR